MNVEKAIILAAGYGKRLLPLTLKTPKPLVKIGKNCLLEKTIILVPLNSYSSFCKLNKPIIQITSDNKDLLQCETKDRIFSLNYKEYENYDNFKRQPRLKIFNAFAGFFIILNSALIIAFSRKEGHF